MRLFHAEQGKQRTCTPARLCTALHHTDGPSETIEAITGFLRHIILLAHALSHCKIE